MDRRKQKEIASAVAPKTHTSTSVGFKEAERERIEAQTKAFLKAGGTVQEVGTKIHVPEPRLTISEVRRNYRGTAIKKRQAELEKKRDKQ